MEDDFKYDVCKNCGRYVYKLSQAGPWIHTSDCSVDCSHPTTAEPEDKENERNHKE